MAIIIMYMTTSVSDQTANTSPHVYNLYMLTSSPAESRERAYGADSVTEPREELESLVRCRCCWATSSLVVGGGGGGREVSSSLVSDWVSSSARRGGG